MKTISDLLERNARWFPDRPAFVLHDVRRSYKDLFSRGARLASAQEKAGAVRQARIAVLSTNSIEYFEIFSACEIGAFIAAPINFRGAPPEILYLLTDSGATMLYFESIYTKTVEGLRASLPGITHYICIDGAAPDWAADYETFLASGDAMPKHRPVEDDYLYLFYTSGTTGKPKGVPLTHRGQMISARATANDPDLKLLQLSPAFHIGGRGPSLGAYWVGGKTVLQKLFDATGFLETIQAERVNATFMVPAMLIAVLDHPDIDKYDLSSLKLVMLASTAIPTALLRRGLQRLGPIFYLAYGSTEAGGVCRLPGHEVAIDGTAIQQGRLASVGHFEADIDGEILDDDGNPCPPGVVGEICIHNSYVFDGYWNNHNATMGVMHGNAFRTGDLAYMDEQDYVFIVDRKKDMLISGGENVYSREVEEALERHPAVRESAVVGKPDPKWGETVCAVILLHPGETLTAEELTAFARTQIASYKCPKTVIFLDEMPRQTTGKIDKVTLRRLHAA